MSQDGIISPSMLLSSSDCGHTGANCVTFRIPGQGKGGSGGWNRRSPVGGLAYGTPRYWMTGPRRSEGSGVRMPRMRPCTVEMTGTVCCAKTDAGQKERERQRERKRDGNPKGEEKGGKGDEGEGVLLVLSSHMMVCLAVAGRTRDRMGPGDGKGYGCADPSEVSNTCTQLPLSLAHSTHSTQSRLLQTTFSPCVCVCL